MIMFKLLLFLFFLTVSWSEKSVNLPRIDWDDINSSMEGRVDKSGETKGMIEHAIRKRAKSGNLPTIDWEKFKKAMEEVGESAGKIEEMNEKVKSWNQNALSARDIGEKLKIAVDIAKIGLEIIIGALAFAGAAGAALTPILGPVGPVLAAVSALISLILSFFASSPPENEQLREIKKGFSEMHYRFDILDMRFRELSADVNAVSEDTKYYIGVDKPLSALGVAYINYANSTKAHNQTALDRFISLCKDHTYSPDFIEEEIRKFATGSGVSGRQSLRAIIDSHNYHMSKITHTYKYILLHASRAAFMTQFCLEQQDKSEDELKQAERNSETFFNDTANAIDSITSDIKAGFTGEKQLVNYTTEEIGKHQAKLSTYQLANHLQSFLADKYSWYHWAVIMYDDQATVSYDGPKIKGEFTNIKEITKHKQKALLYWVSKALYKKANATTEIKKYRRGLYRYDVPYNYDSDLPINMRGKMVGAMEVDMSTSVAIKFGNNFAGVAIKDPNEILAYKYSPFFMAVGLSDAELKSMAKKKVIK